MIRLFVKDPLAAGTVIAPSVEQSHYLISVMRLKSGDEVLLFNGVDGEWRASVGDVFKRGCLLQVAALIRPQTGSPEVELIIALVKRARLETIVEKAVELGARRIRLLLTRRTNDDHIKLPRLNAIAMEAAEQTGRLDVPDIVPAQKFDAMLDEWPDNQSLMFCDEAGDDPSETWGGALGRAAPAFSALRNAAAHAAQHKLQHDALSPPTWAVLVGPEGGFAPEERARLRSLSFVAPVTLGPRILRADTAAIAALTLWQAALGDWNHA